MCEVVVGVGHVDQTLDEVGTLYEAEEHLETNRHKIKSRSVEDTRGCFDNQLEEHLPQSAEGCEGLSRAPRWTCGICPATPACVGCRRGRTRRRRRGRPGPGLRGPPQTGRSASAGRPGSRAATAEETDGDMQPYNFVQEQTNRTSLITETLLKRSGLAHHSPGLLVFGLQDA